MKLKRFIRYCAPLLLWLGVIFFGSTDVMSAEHTSRSIVPLLRWLKADISGQRLTSIHVIVRKCERVRGSCPIAGSRCDFYTESESKRSVLVLYMGVWIACVVAAATDEFHQTFVASRGASVGDIIIDGGGAILGLLIGAMLAMSPSIAIETAPADP